MANLNDPSGAGMALIGADGTPHRVYDLEQPRIQGMPIMASHLPGYAYFLHRRHTDTYDPENMGSRSSASGVIVCMEHSGTHIDALCHQADDLTLFGNVSVAEAEQFGGYSQLAIEDVPPLIGPGILLDVPAAKGVERLPAGYAVTVEDIERCCASQQVDVRSGDVVLVRTGNAQLWHDPVAYLDGPGVSAAVSVWLADRGVMAVGADNMAWDLIGVMDPDYGCQLPGHLILLARRGVYIVENVHLEALSAARAYRFTFICTPLKFVGATGSPVRPIALVAEAD